MIKIKALILAAGKGTRLENKELPKALLPLNGISMLKRVVNNVLESGIDKEPTIVVGHRAEEIINAMGSGCKYILQEKLEGTGSAVLSAKRHLQNSAENILVIYADNPLISSYTIRKLTESHINSDSEFTMAVIKTDDFEGWKKSLYDYGRIIRDSNGNMIKSVELKDTTEDQKNIKEVNPSLYCYQASWLWENLDKLKNGNKQKEYYLTDLIELAIKQGKRINTVEIESSEGLGINTFEQLEIASKLLMVNNFKTSPLQI